MFLSQILKKTINLHASASSENSNCCSALVGDGGGYLIWYLWLSSSLQQFARKPLQDGIHPFFSLVQPLQDGIHPFFSLVQFAAANVKFYLIGEKVQQIST